VWKYSSRMLSKPPRVRRGRFVYKEGEMRPRYEPPEKEPIRVNIPEWADRLYEVTLIEGFWEEYKPPELPNTTLHVIGMEKDPRGKELSGIVSHTLRILRERALPLRPPYPSGRSVFDFMGNPYIYSKNFRPTTLESGRRMIDFMGNVNEYLHGIRPSLWELERYINSVVYR